MKLARIGEDERPVIVLSDSEFSPAPSSVTDFDEAFFSNGGMQELKDRFSNEGASWQREPLDPALRIGSPVARPSAFICIGLNYENHVREVKGADADAAIAAIRQNGPEIFFKAPSAICGPNDAFIIPRGSLKSDYEVEVGIVIGKRAYGISPDEALKYIAGFVAVNDGSERAHQMEGVSQWARGKGHPSFGAVGPYLVTPEELDYNNLRLWLKLNGTMRQDGNTRDMILGLTELVAYVSNYMELVPGDIISTGTPPGVGMGQKPEAIFLQSGDVIEMGVDGLGSRKQQVIAAS